MTIEAQAGEWVGTFLERVKASLQNSSKLYEIVNFNGVLVTVNRDSNVDDLLVIYDLKCQLNRLKWSKND